MDAIETGPAERRARDAHVYFFGPSIADHLDDLAAGGPPNDRVVDDHHALAADGIADGVELQTDTEVSDRLLGLDEGAAHVVTADETELEGDPRSLGVAHGCGNA